MRCIRAIILLTLLLAIYSPVCEAQNGQPNFEIFVEGGGSFLNSGKGTIPGPPTATACDPTKFFCPGTAASASFTSAGRVAAGGGIRFTPQNAFEVSYSLSANRFSIRQGSLTTRALYNRVDLVSFNYLHYFSDSSFQPFATVGLGLSRFRLTGPSAACAAVYPSPCAPFGANANNGFQFAGNFGGGIDVVLQRHIALRLEIRDYVTGQPSFIKGTSHNITSSAGIVFRFK